MADFHYHANHIDAPARGSKAAAMKDARTMHVAYNEDNWLDGRPVGADTLREHGGGYPSIIKCRRQDCVIKRAEIAAQREP